ncbi:MAG: hypothetical protein Kow0098_29430 [Ignavibacteriaceae bacterium]
MRIIACKISSDVQMLNMTRNQRKDIYEFVKQVVSSFNIKLKESKFGNQYLIAILSVIKL